VTSLDFMVQKCIWDANHGLGPKRVNFTAELMERVGNIPKGQKPKYEDIVDLSFANEAIKELGERAAALSSRSGPINGAARRAAPARRGNGSP
jgi:hypothetical protein